MNLNRELSTKIISIAALAVLGYVFFISVYSQIIVQSGGFFYVIIFGGILILGFVLLSLVTKILDISDEVNDNFMWDVVEVVLLCFSAYLFLVFRLSYKSSVPAEETVIYRAAALIREKSLATKGMDMISHLIMYPSQYVYARFLAGFFKMTDTGSGAFITLNAIILILTAFLMDRVVRKIAGRACGLMAALCTLFIPSQSFAVYSYSSEFFLCFIMILTFDVLLIVTDGKKRDKKRMIVYDAIFGFLLALLLFTEPLTLICIISFLVYFMSRRKVKEHYPVSALGVICAVMLVMLLIFGFTKASALNRGFGEVTKGGFARFSISRNPDTEEKYTIGEVFKHFHSNLDNQNTNVNDNYLFLEGKDGESYTRNNSAWFTLGTQMSYMFIIVMAIACAYYMLRNKHREVTPCLLLLFGSFIMLLYRSTKENSTYYLFEVLMMIGCIGIHYMYMNHHSDIPVLLSEMANSPTMSPATLAGTLARAKSLILVDHSRDKEPKIEINEEQTIAQQSMDDQFMTDGTSQQPGAGNGIASEFSIFSGGVEDYGDGSFGGQIGDMFGAVPGASDPGQEAVHTAASGDFIAQSMDDIGRLAEQYTEDAGGDNMFDEYLYGTDGEYTDGTEEDIEEYPEEYEEYPEEFEEYVEEYPEEYTDEAEGYTGEYAEEYTDEAEEYAEEYPEEYPEEYADEAEEYPEEYADEYPEEYPEEYDDVSDALTGSPAQVEGEYAGDYTDTFAQDIPEEVTEAAAEAVQVTEDVQAEAVQAAETVQAAEAVQAAPQAPAEAPRKKSAFSNTASALGFSLEQGLFDEDTASGSQAPQGSPAVKKKVIKKKVIKRVVKKQNP